MTLVFQSLILAIYVFLISVSHGCHRNVLRRVSQLFTCCRLVVTIRGRSRARSCCKLGHQEKTLEKPLSVRHRASVHEPLHVHACHLPPLVIRIITSMLSQVISIAVSTLTFIRNTVTTISRIITVPFTSRVAIGVTAMLSTPALLFAALHLIGALQKHPRRLLGEFDQECVVMLLK